LASACHGLPLLPSLNAYALSFVTGQVSAAIRLGIVGQAGGLRVIAALRGPIAAAARNAAAIDSVDDLGTATFSADLCSLEHETQYTRLFRS
jgi:urease accessory protein